MLPFLLGSSMALKYSHVKTTNYVKVNPQPIPIKALVNKTERSR